MYCCPTAAKAPSYQTGGFSLFWYLQELREGDRRGSNPRPPLLSHIPNSYVRGRSLTFGNPFK